MLKRTRVSGKLDTTRLSNAVSRPGIDPRTWISLAVAVGESQVDAAHGVFVDVQLVPNGEKYTARLGAIYAGNGFGFYAKVHAGDELVVAVPNGAPGHGCMAIARPWNAADLPPADLGAHADDVMLVIEADKNFDIKVQGGGFVHLGDVSPTDFVALAQKVLVELQRIQTYMALLDGVLRTIPVPPQPPSAPDVLWTALQTAIVSTPYPTPQSVAATKVKAL